MNTSVANLNMKLSNLASQENIALNHISAYDKNDINEQKSEKLLKITNFFPLLKPEGKSNLQPQTFDSKDLITKQSTVKENLGTTEQTPCNSSETTSALSIVSEMEYPACDAQIILPGKNTSLNKTSNLNILKTSISQILRLKLRSSNYKKETNNHIGGASDISKNIDISSSIVSLTVKNAPDVEPKTIRIINENLDLCISDKYGVTRENKNALCNEIVTTLPGQAIEPQTFCKARKGTFAYSAKTFTSTSVPSLKGVTKNSHNKQQSETLPLTAIKSTTALEPNAEDMAQSIQTSDILRLPSEETKSASQPVLTVNTLLPDQPSYCENQGQITNFITSPKKQKRRHFKGATYNLYLSPTKKRRHKKKNSDTSSSIRDDESSIGGNENDSFIDSEGDNSLCSEDYCSLSEKSVQEDDLVLPITNHLTPANKSNKIIKESGDPNCFGGYSGHQYSAPYIKSVFEENSITEKKCSEMNTNPLDKNKENIIGYNDSSVLLSQGVDNNLTQHFELNLVIGTDDDKKLACSENTEKDLTETNEEKAKIITTVIGSDKHDDTALFQQVQKNFKCSQHLQRIGLDDNEYLKKRGAIPKNSEAIAESSVVDTIHKRENCDLENHLADGTIKDSSLSTIATCVKSRQRIKRRFTDDIVDTDAGILSLNCMPSSKKSKDNCSSILKPLSVNKVDAKSGSASKIECVYDYKLSPIGTCCCCEMPLMTNTLKSKVYCQAVDSFYENRLGCCNTVLTQKLVHSSVKYPFIMMCEMHLWRLNHHHCCPGCGLFCSEGAFMACYGPENEANEVHFFHHQCMSSSESNQLCCPHCGNSSKVKSINLEFHASVPPDFSHRQMLFSHKARMSFSKKLEIEADHTVSSNCYTVNETGKVISSAGLPQESDRIQLEKMLVSLTSEKGLSLKYSIRDMYTAAATGDVTKVLCMIASGFDPNFKFDEHENETALHTAAATGNLLIVHLLIQAGAVPDSMNDHLYTPLMLAIESHNKDIILYLIGAGAHLQAQGEDGMTCLHLAAKSGNSDMCEILLNSGIIDVNIQDEGGWTPLVWATEHKHLNVVKLLVRRGADPNIMDNEENIGLHWSAFSGSPEICRLFLNMGCDVNAVNEHGDTPLHIAARQDVYGCIFLFLSRGGNSQALNKANKTASECCVDQSSEVYLALNMNMSLKKIISKFNHRAEKVIHRDISKGKEKIPIQCVNSVDNEPPPFDFLYILENCETSPINFDRTTTTLSSCKCAADCYSFGCACGNISFRCWYDKEGCLVPEFNFLDPPLIFECNRTCSCWQNCGNRVIQNGIICRLQLIRTKGKGWGVRTLKDIPKGAFICEYVGELITDPEADRRAEDSYLFDLDYKDGDTFCLDARFYGNISRFINHLCEPNLIPVKAFVDHQDLRYPRIAFFSSREIKAYEELGFDYGEKFWSIKYKSFTCHCNSPKCKYSKDTVLETLANYNRRLREEQCDS